jgi:hypothetical protein
MEPVGPAKKPKVRHVRAIAPIFGRLRGLLARSRPICFCRVTRRLALIIALAAACAPLARAAEGGSRGGGQGRPLLGLGYLDRLHDRRPDRPDERQACRHQPAPDGRPDPLQPEDPGRRGHRPRGPDPGRGPDPRGHGDLQRHGRDLHRDEPADRQVSLLHRGQDRGGQPRPCRGPRGHGDLQRARQVAADHPCDQPHLLPGPLPAPLGRLRGDRRLPPDPGLARGPGPLAPLEPHGRLVRRGLPPQPGRLRRHGPQHTRRGRDDGRARPGDLHVPGVMLGPTSTYDMSDGNNSASAT